MAVTLLDNQIATAAPSTSITVTLSSAPSAGDTLIAFVGHSDDFPAVPSGWTQVAEAVQTGVLRVFTKTASGSEGTTIGFTAPSPGGFAARVLRYTGLNGLDGVGGNASSGTNQILFGSVVTTAADTLVFASGFLHATALPSSDMTWNNSFTQLSADAKTTGTGKLSQLGLATYTASSAGSFTTTASYVPNASTGVEGVILAFAISTAPASSTGTMSSVTVNTGWTPTGGTMQGVLADSNDVTLATSVDNPSNELIDGVLSPLAPPAGDFTVRLRARKVGASSGSVTGKLYVGTSLYSTITVNLPDALSTVDIVFPANQLTGISPSAWAAGLRLTIEATAAV